MIKDYNYDELLHILKTSIDYDSFYKNCIDEGFNDDNVIEKFYENNKDFEGLEV